MSKNSNTNQNSQFRGCTSQWDSNWQLETEFTLAILTQFLARILTCMGVYLCRTRADGHLCAQRGLPSIMDEASAMEGHTFGHAPITYWCIYYIKIKSRRSKKKRKGNKTTQSAGACFFVLVDVSILNVLPIQGKPGWPSAILVRPRTIPSTCFHGNNDSSYTNTFCSLLFLPQLLFPFSFSLFRTSAHTC